MATIDCLHPESKDQRTSLIFVHGLGGDPVLTWMHPSGGPNQLLAGVAW